MERTSGLRFAAIVLLLIMLTSVTIAPLVMAVSPTVHATSVAPTTNNTVVVEEEVIVYHKTIEELMLEQIQDMRYKTPTTPEEANELSQAAIRYKNNLWRSLPAEDSEDYAAAYAILQPEIVRIIVMNEQYCRDYVTLLYYEQQEAHFEKCAQEYPVATQVWLYMKNEFGWSDTVCAGIMGNLMAECGGCWTSDLNWQLDKPHGTGMVQWLGSRRTQLKQIYGDNPTVEEQLEFMRDELYGTDGVTKQVTDWQLNKIMNAETPEECAFAFATYFERCAEQHRSIRKGYARRAYEYFVFS